MNRHKLFLLTLLATLLCTIPAIASDWAEDGEFSGFPVVSVVDPGTPVATVVDPGAPVLTVVDRGEPVMSVSDRGMTFEQLKQTSIKARVSEKSVTALPKELKAQK